MDMEHILRASESSNGRHLKGTKIDWFGQDGTMGVFFPTFVGIVFLLLTAACCIFRWRRKHAGVPTRFHGWGLKGKKVKEGENPPAQPKPLDDVETSFLEQEHSASASYTPPQEIV